MFNKDNLLQSGGNVIYSITICNKELQNILPSEHMEVSHQSACWHAEVRRVFGQKVTMQDTWLVVTIVLGP